MNESLEVKTECGDFLGTFNGYEVESQQEMLAIVLLISCDIWSESIQLIHFKHIVQLIQFTDLIIFVLVVSGG